MNQDDRQHYIFKSLDNPIRILFWNVDEFLLIVIPFFIGLIFGSVVVSVLTISIVIYLYKKFKKRYRKLYFSHLMYWNLPTGKMKKIGIYKSLPFSHIREYFR